MIGYIDDYLCKWAEAYGGDINIGVKTSTLNPQPGIVHSEQIVEIMERCILSMDAQAQTLVKERYLGRKQDKLVAERLGISVNTYRIKLDCVHNWIDGWLHQVKT